MKHRVPTVETGERWIEAGIAAEQSTGEREETVAQARVRVALRLVRGGAGSSLLGLGVLMLVLPGPGWLVIGLGLAVLARDVAWAERALERVRSRLPADADGNVSRASVATAILVALATIAISIAWITR